MVTHLVATTIVGTFRVGTLSLMVPWWPHLQGAILPCAVNLEVAGLSVNFRANHRIALQFQHSWVVLQYMGIASSI